MIADLLQVAGGIGLFLLGMLLLTDGLRAVAGDALERSLRRFTRSPFSGAVTGMLATALVQSSTATTVTAVGFASAAILSFPQALGIVFGANIGTTLSGWLVALLGFRVHVAEGASLLVLVGALLRLFGRGRGRNAGLAVAGFGVVFLGFASLQQGMTGFQGLVTPEHLPPDTLGGRVLLVGIGFAITQVTRSSHLGVATAIAAISTGAIGFGQAAALVIGMDMGTTVSAALATLGASLPGRRTGWAHVIFNAMTGVGAFFLLPLYVLVLEWLLPDTIATNPELALVGFHTSFNVLGVAAVLPFAGPFARLVERLVPERPARLAAGLDRRFLAEPSVALRSVGVTLANLARLTFGALRALLEHHAHADDALADVREALDETQRYLARIPTPGPSGQVDARELAALHIVDQLRRLVDRCEQRRRIHTLSRDAELREAATRLSALIRSIEPEDEAPLAALESELTARRSGYRRDTLQLASTHSLSNEEALARLDAHRWLERVTHHAWRIVHHLAALRLEHPVVEGAVEPPESD